MCNEHHGCRLFSIMYASRATSNRSHKIDYKISSSTCAATTRNTADLFLQFSGPVQKKWYLACVIRQMKPSPLFAFGFPLYKWLCQQGKGRAHTRKMPVQKLLPLLFTSRQLAEARIHIRHNFSPFFG